MKKQHGGKREGAGRPATEGKKVTVTVYLPQWLLSKLDEIGDTRSKKVEDALKAHFDLSE